MAGDRNNNSSPEFERYGADARDRTPEARLDKHRHRARYLIDGARGLYGLQPERILDAGCGAGLLLSHVSGDAQLYGFDANEELAAATGLQDRADISVRDIYDTGYPENHFDIAFCSQVLEHLERPERALAELARVLKPNGVLAASVPCDEQIKMELCIHCGKTTPRNGHLHSFNEANLDRYLPPELSLQRSMRICLRPVYNRFHGLPVPIFRMLDRLALAVGGQNAKWLAFFARKTSGSAQGPT